MGESEPESQSDGKDILLVEYQKSQDSAEHHDSLLWTVTGLILAGMGVLFGLAVGGDGHPEQRWPLAPIGLLFCVALVFFPRTFAHIRNQKYERCKAIEKKLGMEQHSKLDHPKPWICGCLRIKQMRFLNLVNLLFFFGWMWLLYLVVCRQ